jgi:hypothetical protein
MTTPAWHRGGCHCGAIHFEVQADVDIEALDCNCSICAKAGYLHLIVPRTAFRLQADESQLIRYRFGSGVGEHLFCRICGVKSFYIPRSNPDGVDVNVRCLEPDGIRSLRITPFDGRGSWESAAAGIAHLSNAPVDAVQSAPRSATQPNAVDDQGHAP